MTCEDAPCCGCCGTGVYGRNDGYGYDEAPDFDDDYYSQDDYIDPSECKHDGNFDNIDPIVGTVTCYDCDTEGVCFSIMGETIFRFPVTEIDYSVNEDAAMESGLFGDC
jgi:hypothetical protein